MTNRERFTLSLLIWVAWVLVMLASAPKAPALGLHRNARARYVRQVYYDLQKYGLMLGAYAAHPPDGSTAQEDAMYVTRGECDIVIVEEKLARYAHQYGEKADVESALKNLARDIEDAPVPNDHDQGKS